MKRSSRLSGMVMMVAAMAPGQTGVIQGTIVGKGKLQGLPGVTVTLTRMPEPGAYSPLVSRQALTDGAGGFVFAGLPKGVYEVCPSVRRSVYLDPCVWEKRPPRVTLKTDADQDRNVKIDMEEGVVVLVRIDDAKKLVGRAAPGRPVGWAQPVMRRVKGGATVGVPLHVEMTNGKAYAVALPKNEVMKLEIEGVGLVVEDEEKKPAKAKPFVAGQSGREFRFAVVGLK